MRRARRTLTLVTGPTSEPVSVSEANTWARIDDAGEDAIVAQLITAARLAAEEYLRRALISQSYRLTLDLPCGELYDLPEGTYDLPVTALFGGLPNVIELPKGVISSIASVTTYDLDNTSSVLSTAAYRLATDRLVLNQGYTWPSNMRAQGACEIVFVAGYRAATAVPQPIKTGIMIHVASLYEQRGQCEDAMAIPPGARQLYNQYRIMGDRLG